MSLPERIQERLEATGKTARGASLEAGLSPEAIRMILDGNSQSPRMKTIYALADVLECDVAFLAGRQEEPLLAKRLRNRMAELGLNPTSTASKAGLERDYIRDILRGRVASPGADKLRKVADALDTSVDWLLEGADEIAPGKAAKQRVERPQPSPPHLTVRSGGRVTIDIKAEVSVGVAAQILALIEGDKP